jgi:hypothetical protein
MGINQVLTFYRTHRARSSTFAFLFAAGLVLISALAVAQDQATPSQKTRENEGFLAAVSRWWKEQTASFSSATGDAAKTTVEGVKDAAGSVVRIPAARAVSGHEKCPVAPNGAPDCVAAANTICKAKGFGSGKSLDMTTAEVCTAKVYMSGRSTGPECTTDTFVSRAFCQ